MSRTVKQLRWQEYTLWHRLSHRPVRLAVKPGWRADCKARKKGTKTERGIGERQKKEEAKKRAGERFRLVGENVRAWYWINSRHYQQRRRRGLAINSWIDLLTSRSHTYTDTHTQMKLDSSVKDRGHGTVSRDVQFQPAVLLSHVLTLLSFNLECSSSK